MTIRYSFPAALVLMCLSSAWAQNLQYIGAGGCASSNCHGAARAASEKESRILGNEYATWSVLEKHSKAYSVLGSDRSKRMAEILHVGNPQTAKRCLACHAVGSPEKSLSDGVACEACHGPAEKWLGSHTKANSHAQSVTLGMTDTKDASIRAKTCLGCHAGSGDRVVDHEFIAAGHPDLVFQLDAFSAGEPMHWREPKPQTGDSVPRVRIWAVGQAVMTAEKARLLASRASSQWPEFAELECFQCHHDLRADSWRIQRGYDGRKPGSVQLNLAHWQVFRVLVSQAARDRSAELESSVTNLSQLVAGRPADGPAIAQAAQAVAREADLLAARFAKQNFDAGTARAIVTALTAEVGRIADSGASSAEQATMAMDSLAAAAYPDSQRVFQPAIGKLYDYLEHPSAYRPGEFAAQFRKVAGLLQ